MRLHEVEYKLNFILLKSTIKLEEIKKEIIDKYDYKLQKKKKKRKYADFFSQKKLDKTPQKSEADDVSRSLKKFKIGDNDLLSKFSYKPVHDRKQKRGRAQTKKIEKRSEKSDEENVDTNIQFSGLNKARSFTRTKTTQYEPVEGIWIQVGEATVCPFLGKSFEKFTPSTQVGHILSYIPYSHDSYSFTVLESSLYF